MVTWSRLLACITLSGRTAMTAGQCEFFRLALQYADGDLTLATYKTTRTSHWKDCVRISFPKSTVRHLRTTQRHRPTGLAIMTAEKVKRDADSMKDPADCVKVVLPSEWAKLDVLSLSFYKDVFQRSDNTVFDIELAPIVRNRPLVTGAHITLWCTHDDAVCPCEVGDKLRFVCDESDSGAMATSIEDARLHAPKSDSVLRKKLMYVEGVLTLTWLVGATSCIVDSSTLPGQDTLTESELFIVDALRRRTPDFIVASAAKASMHSVASTTKGRNRKHKGIRQTMNIGLLCLRPGDYCALLRPERGRIPGLVCLFVASPTGSITGDTMERLVWVLAKKGDKAAKYICVEAECIVRNLPVWLGVLRALPNFPTGFSPNKGKLTDGSNYFVYRLALYTDGFKQHKSLSDSRSVDGCYMIPLGNSMDGRKSCTTSRVISLTPHGHSGNDVLRLIHGDLIKSATEGINYFDPFGRTVRIFLDVVSMFGDYPALTATADLRGHNSIAFCTFCTFRQNKKSESGSRLYSTATHSRRVSATRTDKRRLLILPNLPESALQQLGFEKETMKETDDLPMLRLVKDLNNPSKVPTDDEERPFMPTGFDSVQSMAAAPDHLICGLIEITLEVCFSRLPSNDERSEIELRMIMDARENGLREQGKFLRWKDNSFDGLRSLSMSTKICMLLTSVRPFNEVHGWTDRSEFLIPQKLQMFVSLVYYVPSIEVEGPPAAELLSPEGYMKLRGNQLRLAQEFLDTAATVHRRNAQLGGILIRPNVHRAIELCVHTITNFGHARNCSEMVLEMAHRKFKGWLEANTHSDSHISGMDRAVCSNWQGRVASMYELYCTGSGIEKESDLRCLCRLFLGEEALRMDETSREGKELIDAFNGALCAAMAEPVRREMELSNPVNFVHEQRFAWEIDRSREPLKVDDILMSGRHILAQWYPVSQADRTVTLTWCNKASYLPTSTTRRRRSYPHLT